MKATNFFDRKGQEILTSEMVSVFEPSSDVLIGWGWFESTEPEGIWFREDIHLELPRGMDTSVVQNIQNYEFEKY